MTNHSIPKHGVARSTWALFVIVFALAASVASADEATPDLRNDILPLLRSRCVKCHGPMHHEGELNLGTPRSFARGGENGPTVTHGKPEDSLLWKRIESNEMPPESPLPPEEKARIKAWIAAGAPGLPSVADARAPGPDHWAFVPPQRPQAPAVQHADQVRNEIDNFVLAGLERVGLALSPEADRATLVRRVSFDLTGLPPTPAEIALYLADPSPDAYARMVDRYLASPLYGQRWGQHWLDAAGYADSNGYFNADTDRPLAYRYRDWVIAALNSDKPFDRFIQEQIAGDELVGYKPDGDVTPEVAQALVATHFLRNAPDGTGESDGNPDEQRIDRFTVIEGTVQVIASSMLGLTVQCARCHDHKFEPVTQAEYYQLQAILWPAYNPDDWRKPKERTAEIGTQAERAEHARLTKELDEQITAAKKELTELVEPRETELQEEKLAKLEEGAQKNLRAAIKQNAKKRNAKQKKLLEQHKDTLDVTDAELAERFPEVAKKREELTANIAELEAKRPAPLEQIAMLTDLKAEAPPHHLLVRGDYRALGDEVGPGVPRSLTGPDREYAAAKPEAVAGSGRRLALARWLTDRRHPLLARITVNRIWQNHFGRGIVTTADNFGYTGAPPTNPELLDYLATEFVENGWSPKSLHRLILNSRAYRQTSAVSADARRLDAENRLVSRFPLQRLEAESVRDSMLRASGELDLTTGGPYVPTTRKDDGEVVVAAGQGGEFRRSIYLQRRRSQVDAMLDVFDAPQVVTNCTRRTSSTIALQSLSLLNSEFVTGRAAAMRERLNREAGEAPQARIALAFLLTTGRAPTEKERAVAERFLAEQPAKYAGQGGADAAKEAEAVKGEPAKAEQETLSPLDHAWQDLCQMLLASNAMLYVE